MCDFFFSCDTAASQNLKCSVSRQSLWFIDNLVLSSKMSDGTALAVVRAIKTRSLNSCVVGNVETQKIEMDGR